MKSLSALLSVTLFGLGIAACSKAPNPVNELEKTAAAMQAAPPPEEAAAAPADTKPISPVGEVQQAIAEYKAGKMEDAVTRLQMLRMSPAMTPEQRMALQDSVASVMSEMYVLAEKGDARAIAAVSAYERMQTRH